MKRIKELRIRLATRLLPVDVLIIKSSPASAAHCMAIAEELHRLAGKFIARAGEQRAAEQPTKIIELREDDKEVASLWVH